MEARVLELLMATQSSAAEPRLAAEGELKRLHGSDQFASALATIGAHKEIAVSNRQAALMKLKNYLGEVWSPNLEEYHPNSVTIANDSKTAIRDTLLAIIFDGSADSKITSATAVVVAKIAKADFPEDWPNLLDLLLGHIGRGNDDQVVAILVVLSELIQGGVDEQHFSRYAQNLIGSLHAIAIAVDRKLMVRAHAVNVFRSCLDLVENLKEREEAGIEAFIQNVYSSWSAFFMGVIEEPMPTFPAADEEAERAAEEVTQRWNGVVALKVQVILTVGRVQSFFPAALDWQPIFNACWQAMLTHGGHYHALYVDADRQSGLVNTYQLPYTFDFLVIEEVDYLQATLEEMPVKTRLQETLASESNGPGIENWVAQVLRALAAFCSITQESEAMWDVDFNVFLSEEAFGETSSSARSVCTGFMWKLCDWLPLQTVESLMGYMKLVFEDANSTWRHKEAAMFLLQQVAEDFESESRLMDPSIISMCIDCMKPTLIDENPFLRARGHMALAAVMVVWMLDQVGPGAQPDMDVVMSFARESIHALDADPSDIVKTSCIRLLREYLTHLPSPRATELQGPVITAIGKFLETRDLDDLDENVDLIDAVLQTTRDAVMSNASTCLDHNALDLMITIVRYGAATDIHSHILIEEAFESAAETMASQGPESYARLCHQILPSLMAAFDIEEPATKENTTLTDVASSLLKILAQSAIAPLPAGFISSAMPRLCRLIFSDVDFYIRQEATLTIKHMLSNDKDALFTWVDPQLQKNGLQMCFLVIGHLLGPSIDDASAAEVGELAVEVIEKAGPDVLGSSVYELLQVVANRLSRADHLGLIQSLVVVFARLSLLNAADVLNFLAELPIGPTTALEVVMTKWLENSTGFVGFDVIRQNIRALVAIYSLQDGRLASITVQGDLIEDSSSRIKTRSMAKTQPIRFTRIPAPLKLLKILVGELIPASSTPFRRTVGSFSHATAATAATATVTTTMAAPPLESTDGLPKPSDGSDGSWESEHSPAGPSPKATDDATQGFLVDFFRSHGQDPAFQELYAMLSDAERARCADAVEAWGSAELQRAELASRHG